MRFDETEIRESLWALSADGTVWQINQHSGQAAPVIQLDDLPLAERRHLQQTMLWRWSQPPPDTQQIEERRPLYWLPSEQTSTPDVACTAE